MGLQHSRRHAFYYWDGAPLQHPQENGLYRRMRVDAG